MWPDEYSTLKLPLLLTQVSVPPPHRELIRHNLPAKERKCNTEAESQIVQCDAQKNTELTWLVIEDVQKQYLRLSNIQQANKNVRFTLDLHFMQH